MSSLGYRAAQLADEALYRLQRQQKQRKARGLLKASQKKLSSAKDPLLQQLLERQRHTFETDIDRIQKMLDTSPDSALYSAESLQQQVNAALAQAEVRAQQIQLEQLKEQAGASLNDTAALLRQIHDPALQQLIGPEIRQLQPELQRIAELVQEDPQKAAAQSKALQKQFNKLLDQTQKQLQKDAAAQADAHAALEEVKQQLEAVFEDSTDAASQILQQVQTLIDTGEDQYRQGQFKALKESCRQAQNRLGQAAQKDFDETVRKEIVQGLLTTLTQRGFVVQPPYLDGQEKASQTVRLLGKLPSGKMAAFTVHLDGRMDFDFEGFQGRACAQELEKIDTMLHEQFSIQLSENQITWKNPDKIAKGALNLPNANRNNPLR